MRILSRKIISICLCLIYLSSIVLLPIRSFALDTGIDSSDINVDILPENPQPYEDVTITLSSYATDLNRAMIIWKNGKNTLQSGYGKISYSFKNLGPDLRLTFIVSITPADSNGSTITKSVSLNSQEVNMLWEAVDSYTPPFYRGKAYASSEANIKVIAIPNSSSLGKSKGRVSYSWKWGEDAQQDASGYNKDFFSFKNNNLNTEESVSVQASSIDGTYNAANTIKIPISDPEIIFYKKSPTEGILYNNALVGETNITEDEATIVGVPYFLSTKGQEYNIKYQWQTNGEDVPTPSIKNELTIQPTSRGGYATISLDIENANLLFQKVTSELKLNL